MIFLTRKTKEYIKTLEENHEVSQKLIFEYKQREFSNNELIKEYKEKDIIFKELCLEVDRLQALVYHKESIIQKLKLVHRVHVKNKDIEQKKEIVRMLKYYDKKFKNFKKRMKKNKP